MDLKEYEELLQKNVEDLEVNVSRSSASLSLSSRDPRHFLSDQARSDRPKGAYGGDLAPLYFLFSAKRISYLNLDAASKWNRMTLETGTGNEDVIWMTNKFPSLILFSLIIGPLMALLIYPLIHPTAPLCMVIAGVLITMILLLGVFIRHFVYRVGIGRGVVMLRKAIKTITVEESAVISLDISPPIDSSAIARPWYKSSNHHLSITLIGERALDFDFIEPYILQRVVSALTSANQTDQ